MLTLFKLQLMCSSFTTNMNKAEKFFAEKTSNLLLKSDNFFKWLQSLPPEEIIGYAGNKTCCPIVKFAKKNGIPVLEVTFGHIDISLSEGHTFAVMGVSENWDVEDNIEDTPYWLSDFVQIVDRINKEGAPVTASQAIAILNLLEDPHSFGPEGIDAELVEKAEIDGRWWENIQIQPGTEFRIANEDIYVDGDWEVTERFLENPSSWLCREKTTSRERSFYEEEILVALKDAQG